MNDGLRLLQERGPQALWDRTLGYFDLPLDEAMAMQHRLLADEIRWLQHSEIGRQVLGADNIASTEEFRERVPLTTYDDYDPTLGEKRDDVLPEPAAAWLRTSGRTRARHKWIPVSRQRSAEMNWMTLGAFILSAARERGEVRITPTSKMLNMTAPPPYASGTFMENLTEVWPMSLFPGPDSAHMPFEARNAYGFSQAATFGVDFLCGLRSVLAGVGEMFGSRRPPGTILDRLKNPRSFARMGRAVLRAKTAGRPLLPKDAWALKGMLVGGMDSSLFRERLREQWGTYPLEMFVSTEGLFLALQAWDRTSLSLVPSLNLLEFVSEDEVQAGTSQPQTSLMDELEPGKNYELVITNFWGGPLVRYRTGDILRVTSSRNDRAGVDLPQVISYGRHSDTMDIGGFVRINEQTMWRAIEDARVPYVEWTARKEVHGDQPVVHLRIEPRPGAGPTAEDAQARIHEALKLLEPDWADMEQMAGLRPLRVTYLPSGSFDRFTESRRKAGADLGQMKPVHMNPTDTAIESLLEAAGVGGGTRS